MSAPTASAPAGRWPRRAVAGVAAVLYAYVVWNALGNLLQSVQAAEAVGKPLNALGWFLWIFAAVLPAVVYAAALRVARRRPMTATVLVMLTGLALVGAFWLDVQAYAVLNTFSLVG